MERNRISEKLSEKKEKISSPFYNKHRLSILVVEDSEAARYKIVQSLKSLNLEIFEADDGAAAVKIIETHRQKIDLVLTDLNMKTMDGDELCRIIRNELELFELPVIVLSSKNDKETTVELFNIGATDFLYKPFTEEELVARINTHIERIQLNKIMVDQIGQLKELNQIKDDLLVVCSHDFRSPLQIIMGYTELMIEDGAINAKNRAMLSSIQESADNLLKMIDEVLLLGKAETLAGKIGYSPQNIKQLVRTCLTNFHSLSVKKNISLGFSDSDCNHMVNGNPNELTRIFNNLLSNAIKFTPEGGKVSVSMEIIRGKAVSIAVRDSGIGIAEDEKADLFTKYSHLSQEGTDGEATTGLGLYITKELVEKNQGEISVESEVAKGSCFTVTFPVVKKNGF